MKITNTALLALLAINPTLSAGQLPFERMGMYIPLGYHEGKQIFDESFHDNPDIFWPNDNDIVHFLDATNRHVFVLRRGPVLELLLEQGFAASRGDEIVFYRQITKLYEPSQMTLEAVSAAEFLAFLQNDQNNLDLSPIEQLLHPTTSQEGNPMNQNDDTVIPLPQTEPATGRVEAIGAHAGAKIDDAVDAAREAAAIASEKLRDTAEHVADTAEHVGDRVADEARVVGRTLKDSWNDLMADRRTRNFITYGSTFLTGAGAGWLAKKYFG